jgi:hypothetical protein
LLNAASGFERSGFHRGEMRAVGRAGITRIPALENRLAEFLSSLLFR